MAMRPHEIHPSLVHFPIALFPSSLAADLVGRLTGSDNLMDLGRRTMPLAAVGAVAAGVAGLFAQEEVVAEGEAHDALVTHRSLNAGFIAAAVGMAFRRRRRERPGGAYLAVGLSATVALLYSAYLGGRMVYELGVGVKAAGGIHEERASEIGPENAASVAGEVAKQSVRGARHAAHHAAEGEIAPALGEEADEDA